jgi:hypothetical protein
MSRPAHRKVLECASLPALLPGVQTFAKRQRAAAVQDASAPSFPPPLRALALFAPSFLLFLFAAGCSTPLPPNIFPHVTRSFPADALITQRAVLTARGRQFTLNGYLALSATSGKRLIVTENFGSVLADVLVKRDGTIRVMRSSRIFRPAWIERYVAADMQCIFGGTPDTACPIQMLSTNHFLIERRWYKLDLHIVETKPGSQPVELFDETHKITP